MAAQYRVSLFTGDEEGFLQVGLFPEIGVAGEVDLLGEFVEGIKRKGFFQVVFDPFVIVIFQESAGIGSGYQVVVFERAVDDCGKDGIQEFLRTGEGGAGRRLLRTGGQGDKACEGKGRKAMEHVLRSGKLR